jgi:hypothetical protein
VHVERRLTEVRNEIEYLVSVAEARLRRFDAVELDKK